ncbi:uncharacterized protein MICPUCDRAFT_57816 [Micromonas pusilla CCMP1545]|uniref:Predicted protein n=1 Tax=Micromonas pusilla (strain CCMP1545) TaxID=564608 RepID=C1MST6_MICPC|nr:uncharacterized protein MICPUCDRAFT_57816 [Micromonas pusilla CCMP1545]EEH56835.1 predicted protein [Micromonas pusilla CCMP1545]|eukprot:XP_003058380.1 predicted protein [Micromonas pusilla CCMP1545]
MGAMKKTSSKFNKSEVLKLKEVFDEADKDGSGEIDTAELAQSLQKTNLGEAAADMFRAIDKDGTKSLDFSEYLKIKSIFVLYDANNNGTLCKKELTEALTATGYDDEEVEDMFEDFDEDGSGEIDFEEFCKMLESSYLD